jgi:hypothetical protein
MTQAILDRRRFLQFGAAASAALALPLSSRRRAHAQAAADRRFLFVIAATGGASIIDSFLPVAASESADPENLMVYPDELIAQPAGSNLRCVTPIDFGSIFSTNYDMRTFLSRHASDTAVMCLESTSVNHTVAQRRAVTGAGIDGGRTLMEAMAMTHGDGLLLPNCNMASGGFIEPSEQESVPDWARGELINDPRLFGLSTSGTRGLLDVPEDALVRRAREVRDRLDDSSPFAARHADSALRKRFRQIRTQLGGELEAADLITKLMLYRSSAQVPLDQYGLASSPELERLESHFPRILEDDLQAQAALAFLLARYDLSCAVTFGPGFEPSFLSDGTLADTPIAFDFSHRSHVVTQNFMWGRILSAVDGLISLLKEQPYGDGSESMWDHSLVYIATDFGRTKSRPTGSYDFGSGHDLNNGTVIVSPMIKGNQVYGGIDPDTCLTHGFDPVSGQADPQKPIAEGHVYSAICQALGIDFPNRQDMSGVVR